MWPVPFLRPETEGKGGCEPGLRGARGRWLVAYTLLRSNGTCVGRR